MTFDFLAASEQSQASAKAVEAERLDKALSSCCRDVAKAEELLQRVAAMTQSNSPLDPGEALWVTEKIQGLSATSTENMTEGDLASFRNHLAGIVDRLSELSLSNAMPPALAAAITSICDTHTIALPPVAAEGTRPFTHPTPIEQTTTTSQPSLQTQTTTPHATVSQGYSAQPSPGSPNVNLSATVTQAERGGFTAPTLYSPTAKTTQGESQITTLRRSDFLGRETALNAYASGKVAPNAEERSQAALKAYTASDVSPQRSGVEGGDTKAYSNSFAREQSTLSPQSEGVARARSSHTEQGSLAVEGAQRDTSPKYLERSPARNDAALHDSINPSISTTLKVTQPDSARINTPMAPSPSRNSAALDNSPASARSRDLSSYQAPASTTNVSRHHVTHTRRSQGSLQARNTSSTSQQRRSNNVRTRATYSKTPVGITKLHLSARATSSRLQFPAGASRSNSRGVMHSRDPGSTRAKNTGSLSQSGSSAGRTTLRQKLLGPLGKTPTLASRRSAEPLVGRAAKLQHINLILRELRGLSSKQISTLLARSTRTPELRAALAIKQRAQAILHRIKDVQLKKLAAIAGLHRSRMRRGTKTYKNLSQRERLARREVRAYLRRLEQQLSFIVAPGSMLYRRLTSELTSSDLERLISIIGGARSLRGLKRKQRAGQATSILEADISNVFLQELAAHAGTGSGDFSSAGDEGSGGAAGEVAHGESTAPAQDTETQLVAEGATPTTTLTTVITKEESPL